MLVASLDPKQPGAALPQRTAAGDPLLQWLFTMVMVWSIWFSTALPTARPGAGGERWRSLRLLLLLSYGLSKLLVGARGVIDDDR